MPILFGPDSVVGWRNWNIRMLASSACYWIPVMRNLLWWGNLRPASKHVMKVRVLVGGYGPPLPCRA